jgi:iron complex transport system permease protein
MKHLIQKKLLLAGCALTIFLVVSVIVSLGMGSVSIPISKVTGTVLSGPGASLEQAGDTHSPEAAIIWKIRLPRALLAVLVGIGLSVSGAGFQGALRNPLAEPYLLGISSSCALGAVIVIILGGQSALGIWTLPLFAFASGSVCLFLVFRIAGISGNRDAQSLILAGVILNAFLSAILSLLLITNHESQAEILFWLMGSLSLKGWEFVGVLAPYIILGSLVLWPLSRAMNLLALGDAQAFHTGLGTARARWAILGVSSLIAAACVAVSGTVGFVGLVIPHIVRLITGPDYRTLIPFSGLLGGALLLWGDNVCRLAAGAQELPLGVVTAFIGAPFFLWLLFRHKRSIGL